MRRWLIVAMCLLAGCHLHPSAEVQQTSPRVFLLDANHIQSVRQKIRDGDKSYEAGLQRIRNDGDKALNTGPFAVTNKEQTPPSGDKHDYMSQAPYFWPDPSKPDGLPYIRKDGDRNPEIRKIPNHDDMGKMMGAVHTLAIAYYFTGDEKYAEHATLLLRTWFLNADTKMNPNLNFGQAIPGITPGRGRGLVETEGLANVVDAIGLLNDSKSWTLADQAGMEQWFTAYLDWLQKSPVGQDEAAAKNNHGTYYDVQLTSIALFVGNKELATSVIKQAREKRIAVQIEPDGRMPLELARTKSWHYSMMNLHGLFMLATLGDDVGVDLWHYQTSDGRCMKKAVDWMLPFGTDQAKWPYNELGGGAGEGFYPLLAQAAKKYPDQRYQDLLAKHGGGEQDSLIQ